MNEEQILKRLAIRRRTVICLYVVTLLLAISAAILFFIRRELVLPVLILLLLFYWLVVSVSDKQYAKSFVQWNLLLSAKHIFADAEIADRQTAFAENLIPPALFPASPGSKQALTQTAVVSKKGFISEIITFYQVPKAINRHGVLLLRGILMAIDIDINRDLDLVYYDSDIFPLETAHEFYLAMRLAPVPLPHSLQTCGTAYGTVGAEQFFLRFERDIKALAEMIHRQNGRMLLRIYKGRIYLLHEGKTLQMNVPLSSLAPKSALETNRIKEADVLLRICRSAHQQTCQALDL